MARHSNIFDKFLNKLEGAIAQLASPIEKALWEENSSEKSTPRQNAFWDLNAMMGFTLRNTKVTKRTAAFMGDLWDYSDQIDDCDYSTERHLDDVDKYIEKNKLLNVNPPTYLVWLLQKYDAKNETQFAAVWVGVLIDFMNILLAETEVEASAVNRIREVVRDTWGAEYFEQATNSGARAVKMPGKFASPSGERVCKRLEADINSLMSAMNAITKASPLLNANDGWELMTGCMLTALPYMSHVDGVVTIQELNLMRDLFIAFGGFDETMDMQQFGEVLQAWLLKQDNTRIMTMLAALKEYDAIVVDANYAAAKSMFAWLAEQIFKSDSEGIAPQESQWLQQFAAHTPVLQDPEGFRAALTAYLGATKSEDQAQEKVETVEEIIAELNALTGLERVKQEMTQLINFIKVQQMREAKGIAAAPISKHLVFMGNPGTGKTTVARIVSRVYKALGILERGHLVEADRAALVAGYVGQTALKVTDVVKSALGGVLFIDEAYSLNNDDQDSFGREAIDALLKLMEDHRATLVVIVAGYSRNMEKFLESNPGLKSRFNKYIMFEDYNPEELLAIFDFFCGNSGFHLSDTGRAKLHLLFKTMYNQRDEKFGNGRDARNVFEKAITKQADRIVALPHVDDKALTELNAEDIPDLRELSVSYA